MSSAMQPNIDEPPSPPTFDDASLVSFPSCCGCSLGTLLSSAPPSPLRIPDAGSLGPEASEAAVGAGCDLGKDDTPHGRGCGVVVVVFVGHTPHRLESHDSCVGLLLQSRRRRPPPGRVKWEDGHRAGAAAIARLLLLLSAGRDGSASSLASSSSM